MGARAIENAESLSLAELKIGGDRDLPASKASDSAFLKLKMHPQLLIPEPTRKRLAGYRNSLLSGALSAGARLAQALKDQAKALDDDDALLAALLDTKRPQIFAESAVAGNGSDWSAVELGLLGDLSVAVQVRVFDDGKHHAPTVHEKPFPATLVFTPGALLRNGRGCCPADWSEVVFPDQQLNEEGYFGLYERRLLPVCQFVSARACATEQSALVTLPGLGCGQFAGPFAGQLGAALERVLVRFLETHGASLPGIAAVVFDPYNECANSRRDIHGISLRVRPLLDGNQHRPQLAHPAAHADEGEDFSECALFSVVAWDHVSWPGNDFLAGSRCTDDGVKAAATDCMRALTGVEGRYDKTTNAYLPPPPFRTWEDLVIRKGLSLSGLIRQLSTS
jgi:hypothetical protein